MDLALASAAGLAVVWVPGAVVARALRIGGGDCLIRFAQQCALGLSIWPILFLYTSLIGVTWSATGARAALLVAGCWLLLDSVRRKTPAIRLDPIAVCGLALTTLVVFTRIRQIRDVALPLWVDSVHHTMIVRLLVDHGRLPSSYEPFIEQSTFYYHWGFHAVTAIVAWVASMTSLGELPRLLLAVGQLLNALVWFAVYSVAVALFRSRRTALLAATLAALVSLFPAYYVSWGRYTQLCGILILPSLGYSFWRLGRHPSLRRAIEVVLLGAGLLLIHVRVAIVFAILAAVLVFVLAIQRRWKGLAWCAASGLVAVLVTGPWLVQLIRTPEVRTILAPSAEQRGQWETSNVIPGDLLWAPHNAILFAGASGGLLWGLVVIPMRKGRTARRWEPSRIAILVTWVVATAILINLDRVGLPRLRLVPNSAGIILLFLPVSLAAAQFARWLCDEIVKAHSRRLVMMIASLTVGLIGASSMLEIVNPTTVLATAADRRALAWIHSHTAPDAQFAVGVQPWIGGSFIGVDGGYWISLLAERRTNLPPGLYRWVMPADRADAITRQLTAWNETQLAADLRALAELRRDGVTHIYFGPRNATPLRSAIPVSPLVSRVYSVDGVEIYALHEQLTLSP